MATYTSTRAGSGASAKARTGVVVDYAEFTIATAPAANDIIKLFKLPAMARVLEFAIDFPILDTGGSACRVAIGDTANGAGQYFAAGLSLGSGFSAAAMVHYPSNSNAVAGSLGTRYTSDDALQVKISTGPTTGATTGTIHAWVMYEMDGGTQAGF